MKIKYQTRLDKKFKDIGVKISKEEVKWYENNSVVICCIYYYF